jgi:hypothetical protein
MEKRDLEEVLVVLTGEGGSMDASTPTGLASFAAPAVLGVEADIHKKGVQQRARARAEGRGPLLVLVNSKSRQSHFTRDGGSGS